jgi:dienelactone hydrolase
MFHLAPASRAVHCARLAGVAVVAVLISAVLAYVLIQGDPQATDTIPAAKSSTGPAEVPLRGDGPLTDNVGIRTPPACPAIEPSQGKRPTTGNITLDLASNGFSGAQNAGKGDALIAVKDYFESAEKKISVLRFEPAGGGRHSAVVMLHGCDGWGQLNAYKFAAEDLVKDGHVVLLIRYYDRTDTPDKFPVAQRNAFTRWLKEGAAQGVKGDARDHFDQWIATVSDAVAYARTLTNVDPQRVGLVGFSLGGYLALSAAPRCNVGAVVEMFGGVPKEKQNELGAMPPTLIVHGNKDAIVPVDEAYTTYRRLLDKAQTTEIQILEGVGHACLRPGTELPDFGKALQARTAMTKFFRTYLARSESVTEPCLPGTH